MNNYYPITEVKSTSDFWIREEIRRSRRRSRRQIISSEGRPFHPAQAPEDSRQ